MDLEKSFKVGDLVSKNGKEKTDYYYLNRSIVTHRTTKELTISR